MGTSKSVLTSTFKVRNANGDLFIAHEYTIYTKLDYMNKASEWRETATEYSLANGESLNSKGNGTFEGVETLKNYTRIV